MRVARRFARVPLAASCCVEVLEPHAAAAAGAARLALAVVLGDHAHAEAHQRLAIARQLAVARGDQDLAQLLGERGLDPDDARVGGARGARRRAAAARACRSPGDVERRQLAAGSARAALRGWNSTGAREPPPARDLRGGARGARHRLQRQLLAVGVAGGVALHHAHAEAHADRAAGRLEDALFEHVAAGDAVLEEQVGVVAALARARLAAAARTSRDRSACCRRVRRARRNGGSQAWLQPWRLNLGSGRGERQPLLRLWGAPAGHFTRLRLAVGARHAIARAAAAACDLALIRRQTHAASADEAEATRGIADHELVRAHPARHDGSRTDQAIRAEVVAADDCRVRADGGAAADASRAGTRSCARGTRAG